jgi:S1-C subfamily serine protease
MYQNSTVQFRGAELSFPGATHTNTPKNDPLKATTFLVPPLDSRREFGPDDISYCRKSTVMIEQKIDSQGGISVGAGFWIKTDQGFFLVTNDHVVEGSNGSRPDLRIMVGDGGGFLELTDVERVGAASRNDIALLRPMDRSFKPPVCIRLANPSDLIQGAPVLAIGNPDCLRFNAVTGNISSPTGTCYSIDGIRSEGCITVTAPINGGNSGGPLFIITPEGIRVAGVVVGKRRDAEGIAFVIPSLYVSFAMNEILRQSHSSDPFE